jgi:hypothetical protein
MPIEYAEIILAVVALFAGILYLRVRRTRTKGKKSKNAVRPGAPARGAAAATTAGTQAEGPAVATWAPPVTQPRPGSVASTVVAPPPQPAAPASPSWDQPAPAPQGGQPPAPSPTRATSAASPAWGAPGAPPPPPAPAAPPPPPAQSAPAPAPAPAWGPPQAAPPAPPAPAWGPAASAPPAAAPPPAAPPAPAWGPPAGVPAPPPAAPAHVCPRGSGGGLGRPCCTGRAARAFVGGACRARCPPCAVVGGAGRLDQRLGRRRCSGSFVGGTGGRPRAGGRGMGRRAGC